MRYPILFLAISLVACSRTSPGTESFNRLATADSPYLRQHATNPVDWYPWGEEALQKAKDENKLMIVSIGYSACHWCHVMEEESFEDSTVAALMNEHFVSIKVDREQRPDLDQIYLDAATLTSGRGGWPLNAITTADGSPIMAGTYFPKDSWMELLNNVVSLKTENPDQVEAIALQVRSGIANMARSPFLPQAPAPDIAVPEDAAKSILDRLDPRWGGFEGYPKFPMPDVHRFLLATSSLTGEEVYEREVIRFLDQLSNGGIYDHVGGGFARYSTDSIWHVPHFEKMLYDNAQLMSLYSEAYRKTGNEAYRRIVAETAGFLQRDLMSESGACFSSLDADSEGEEGTYYVWSEKEFLKTLGMKGKAFKDYFHVVPQGNWEEDRNVLFVLESPAVIAQRHGYTEEEFEFMIPVAKKLLREKREKRELPFRDEKILTGWNALMISGYAEAYRSFGEDSLLVAAEQIASFLLQNMKREDGGLYRSYFEGEAAVPAFAEDYGMLVEALVDLYQVTFEESYLLEARALMDYAVAHFSETDGPYFYFTEGEDPSLIARTLKTDDNVTPSANASLARGLFLIGTYFGETSYIDRSSEMLRNLQQQVRAYGSSYAHWARLSLWLANPPFEVAIVGEDWKAKATDWWKRYDPNVLLLGGPSEGTLPLLARKLVPGTTMIYVCQNKVCQLPVEENDQAFPLLDR